MRHVSHNVVNSGSYRQRVARRRHVYLTKAPPVGEHQHWQEQRQRELSFTLAADKNQRNTPQEF